MNNERDIIAEKLMSQISVILTSCKKDNTGTGEEEVILTSTNKYLLLKACESLQELVRLSTKESKDQAYHIDPNKFTSTSNFIPGYTPSLGFVNDRDTGWSSTITYKNNNKPNKLADMKKPLLD